MRDAPPRPPVIVIGMHRSGTGIFTDLLSRMGMHIGWLKEGNSEAWLFLLINRWLFRKSGTRWDYPLPVRSLMADEDRVQGYRDVVRSLLNSPLRLAFLGWRRFFRGNNLFRMDQPWGWKDPRNTFTLPLWLELFPEARIVHVCRHGVDVASSLRRRQSKDAESARRLRERNRFLFTLRSLHGEFAAPMRCENLDEGFALWEEYTTEAGRQRDLLKADRYLEIRYEDLLEDPLPNLDRIAAFCGLDVPRESLPALAETIDRSRRYAYRDDQDLVSLAGRSADALEKLGYQP